MSLVGLLALPAPLATALPLTVLKGGAISESDEHSEALLRPDKGGLKLWLLWVFSCPSEGCWMANEGELGFPGFSPGMLFLETGDRLIGISLERASQWASKFLNKERVKLFDI